MSRQIRFSITLTLLFLLPISLLVTPIIVGMSMNTLSKAPPLAISQHVQKLHDQLIIADLHADSLLWARPLDIRGRWGHLDLPRMREGRLGLQAFSVVTKAPRGLNIERNDDDNDNVTLLAIAQRWPFSTWNSLMARALYQAQRLDSIDRDDTNFRIIRHRQDLASFLRDRQTNPELIAGWLTIEGAHVLEGNVNHLDALYDAGFRMIGVSHFFDNEMGGSAHGVRQYGLSTRGVEMVQKMDARSMIIDLAHASDTVINDVLAVTQRPVMVSHTGLKGVCDNARNLTDDQAKRIADSGGLIGIGFWPTAVCGNDVAAIVESIRYAVQLVGIEHVALGSDFDGAVSVPFGADHMVQLTEGLIDAGLSETAIRMIMGENVVMFLANNLPR